MVGGGDEERLWSQRYKANKAKLESGDLVQVVEVWSELAGQEASGRLSAGEKRMLASAAHAAPGGLMRFVLPVRWFRGWRLRGFRAYRGPRKAA